MGAGIGKIAKEEKSVKDPEVWRRIKMPAVRGRVEGGGQGALAVAIVIILRHHQLIDYIVSLRTSLLIFHHKVAIVN